MLVALLLFEIEKIGGFQKFCDFFLKLSGSALLLHLFASTSFSLFQCCQIWRLVVNSATFHVKLLLKFLFGLLSILATFLLLLKTCLKTSLKQV